MARLEARELYRFFHNGDSETFALRGVSLTLDGGELVALVGPSGSGKSTLLACLGGLDTPDGGTVLLDDEPITRRPERVRSALRAKRMGILLQSGNLFEHLSVHDNIRLQRRLARVKTAPSQLTARLLHPTSRQKPQTANIWSYRPSSKCRTRAPHRDGNTTNAVATSKSSRQTNLSGSPSPRPARARPAPRSPASWALTARKSGPTPMAA